MPDKAAKIVIAGGGVFGLSTALHLVREGYEKITLIDPYPVPSQLSAANDINKVHDKAQPDSAQSRLTGRSSERSTTCRCTAVWPECVPNTSTLCTAHRQEAYEAWNNDRLFSPHFHKVGWFTGAAGDDERGKDIVAKVSPLSHISAYHSS